jgi:hypothetical protein
LCAQPAPHHEILNDAVLQYNIPGRDFPDDFFDGVPDKMWTPSKKVTDGETRAASAAFVGITVRKVEDFVQKAGVDHREAERVARWAPVKYMDNKCVIDDGADMAAVSKASILEHLVKYYDALAVESAAESPEKRIMMLACKATTKLFQLGSMASVFAAQSKMDNMLANASPMATNERYHFITRPCNVTDGKVMYPVDAGLTALSVGRTRGSDSRSRNEDIWGGLSGNSRKKLRSRVDATKTLRSVVKLGNDPVPLCITRPPGTAFEESAVPPAKKRGYESDKWPGTPETVSIENIHRALQHVLQLCHEKEQLECERDGVKRLIDENEKKQTDPCPDPDDIDDAARQRRMTVWNDSMREAAISGDRLYAFVRQLSGTISETVDDVCQVDDAIIVKQQQQSRDVRIKASEAAAREHMQLVRGVFSSVLKESGLTLGIGADGTNPANLKVMSSTLRKQAEELTSKGSGGDGFFNNAVKLEQLLANGTGEMTLTQLFEKLREAGVALQQAALTSQPLAASDVGASLEFLSAPRNSLLLRYKQETLSAVRSAYATFFQEMSMRGARYTPTAYELMEGVDAMLTNAFATFCGLQLAHSRMHSTSHSAYVSQFAVRSNSTQLRIALAKLVRAAGSYVQQSRLPDFASDNPADARTHYFTGKPGVGSLDGPLRRLPDETAPTGIFSMPGAPMTLKYGGKRGQPAPYL